MTTIIMSIRGRHIRNMEAGRKRIEIRKSRPKGDPPFRVLLCQTGSGGNIVAAFTCAKVVELTCTDAEIASLAAITEDEARGYHGERKLYGWQVEDFRRLKGEDASHIWDWGVTRAPQSWCYARRTPEK